MPQTRLRRGGILVTPYGVATFVSYRERDNVYKLKLPFAELYVEGDSIDPCEDDVEQEEEAESSERSSSSSNDKKAMEINEAYEALEHMRRVNLELACQELGLLDVDHEECTACLMEGAKKAKEMGSPSASRIGWRKRKKTDRCLTCGSPCCLVHSSDVFRQEGITLCNECEKVFHMDFILSCLTLDSTERRERIYHIMDLYDRTVLLLRYSNQYILEVANALEETRKRQSKLNVGGSSAGIVSGVLGVAAAFTILTPAGPPLLIASLLFGGGATAVQTGTEVRQEYFFQPGKVADRILALYGMLLTILTVTGTLRDVALLDQKTLRFVEEDSPALQELEKTHVENREELLAEATDSESSVSIRVDRDILAAAVAAEVKNNRQGKSVGGKDTKSKSGINIVARNSRYMSRLGAGIMRTVQFARFAGGALAAASLLIEAKGMSNAIRSIKSGSCEKAATLRRIAKSLPNFPLTNHMEKECRAYLSYMDQREIPIAEDDAAQLLLEVSTKDEENNSKSESMEGDKPKDMDEEDDEDEEDSEQEKNDEKDGDDQQSFASDGVEKDEQRVLCKATDEHGQSILSTFTEDTMTLAASSGSSLSDPPHPDEELDCFAQEGESIIKESFAIQ